MGRICPVMMIAGLLLGFIFTPIADGYAQRDGGYDVTAGLWAKAVLKPASGDVTLVWQMVGAAITPSGAQVISGYFYADPEDFSYGSPFNPEVFVKIYIDPGGWCNIAFNHVTVDPVSVYSAHQYGGMADQSGTISLSARLSEHTYTGVSGETGDRYTNSLGMTFNLIPAGTFTMGSPSSELGRTDYEIQHQVTLTQSFYMQTTEVTQGQWRSVMGSNPSGFTSCGDDCPVEQVSWNDIQSFLTAMSQRGEGSYRLPTEAEWEYAARAGSTTALANGGITVSESCAYDPNLDAMGWYCGNSDVTYSGCYNSSSYGGPTCAGTHPVAGKQANAWGLYDMHGNVWEWCQDWYGSYPTSAVTDPTGPSSGSCRVLRGGSWFYNARYCRSAYRDLNYPYSRNYYCGFRLVVLPVQ